MLTLSSTVRILCGGAFLAIAAGSGAQASSWQTFDVMASTAVTPTAMGADHTIFGYYANPDSTSSSFIRASDGTLTTFNLAGNGSTKAMGANKNGDTAGIVTENGTTQAFIRTADGQSTLFSVNGSSFTEAAGINDEGWVAGDYIDPATSAQIGYLRRPNGKIQTFAAPDGSNLTVRALNNGNTIVGTYGTHGFIRDSLGNITTLRITANYIVPVAVNQSGVVAGYYAGTNGNIHGFVRPVVGNPKGFDPKIYNGVLQVTGMNDAGIVIGWSTDGANISHGFAVSTTSTFAFATVDAPGGVNGTEIYAVDNTGKMAGVYSDSNSATHAARADATVTGF